jgi:hypothetical protein
MEFIYRGDIPHYLAPIFTSSDPFFSDTLPQGKISLIWAQIPSPVSRLILGNPVKSLFSVPVENMPNNRSVCRNTADLHITYWLLRPFKSSRFLPPIFGHKTLETLPEHEYEGHFFRRRSEKVGFGKLV